MLVRLHQTRQLVSPSVKGALAQPVIRNGSWCVGVEQEQKLT